MVKYEIRMTLKAKAKSDEDKIYSRDTKKGYQNALEPRTAYNSLKIGKSFDLTTGDRDKEYVTPRRYSPKDSKTPTCRELPPDKEEGKLQRHHISSNRV